MSANNPATDNSEEDEREIEITRVFDADRELVFEAWTNPIHVARWWGPQGFSNPICEVDLRVDGKWRVVMRAPDGSEIPFIAVYREVVPLERLVFSSVAKDAAGNSVLEGVTTVLFEDFHGQTKLTVRARAKALVPEAVIRLGGMYEGWTSSLDRLVAEIASIEEKGGRG